ncbi:hypothetical protein FE783_29875 [Paenibacillus mesophilus]|uniref:hypothetical protein n=1 Tax=Paenibacillus mesophilus TaxID=2582849 RepID=UPI00110E840F|nr:hypothetical protein [Paenibacillus mesophilus]TMV45304.1 hypothetical protein FE783_29875 [Paenibacillus mesophilus]
MFRKLILIYKWRKLRLLVWKKRLVHQLDLISLQVPSTLSCSLHLSWGPFYGGSVLMDRKNKKAKILIQIPYDRYVTSDERQVMAKFHITTRALPYFIFFHECYHLFDALSYMRDNEEKDLNSYQAALIKSAQKSTDYRKLQIEQCADDFAYRQYLNLCERAG